MDKKIATIKELTELLNKASEAYYNTGNPIMSDQEFDALLEELKIFEDKTGTVLSGSPTHSVGAKVLSDLKKVQHNHPMLSLDKCHSEEEVYNFFDKDFDILCMPKMDGLTVSIKYVDGKLISAETRGDGLVGCDITEHIKQFKNVPLTINASGTYIVDGEAIITNDDFVAINNNNNNKEESKFANSRNLASGTLNSLDTSVVADRKLQFVVWDVIKCEPYIRSLTERFNNASDLGFTVVENFHFAIHSSDKNVDEIISSRIGAIKKISANYPIDGIVFKYDDIEYGKSLGATAHHFKNAIAYKFKDDTMESTLRDIEWSVGKTGQITPVAIFDPIQIEGSTVERASLHNLSIMYELYNHTWHSGLKVHVKKANQIIPMVVSVEEGGGDEEINLNPPIFCPCCKGKTEIKEINSTRSLFCKNPYCKGKILGKMKHFVSKDAMNIEGLSESTLKKFIEREYIYDFTDIYELSKHYESISHLDGFGEKSANNLMDAIEKSRTTTLDRFINALSIPMIGKTASKTISKFFNEDFMEFYNALIDSADDIGFDWTNLEDFGQSMNDSIIEFAKDENNIETVWDLSTYLNFQKEEKSQGSKLSGVTFVITGKLYKFENRDKAKEFIESNGGKVASAVSKKTDYLINNDILSTSGKNKTAKKFNIPIITEEEMLLMAK